MQGGFVRAMWICAAFCGGVLGLLGCRIADAHDGPHGDPRAVGAIMPRLSPDGQTVACSYQGSIWLVPRVGGVMTRLTHSDAFDIEPVWSPDGLRIAFIRTRGFGAGTLTVVERSTGQRAPLPREVTVMDKLHFDRSGERVLGVFQIPNERPRVAWLVLSTGELQPAVDERSWPGHSIGASGVMRQRFALSHDARWLAVVVVADQPDEQTGNNGPQNELWRVPLGGGEPQLIVRWPARIHELAWRADDRALFVVTERGGVHNDIWEVPLENSDAAAKKITFGQADEDRPSVSDDGRWLVFSDNRPGPTLLIARELANGHEHPISPARLDFGVPTGRLHLHLSESPADPAAEDISARLVVRATTGESYAPSGALYRLLGQDLHFYARGGTELDLPAGQYTVKVARGPEHRTTRQPFVIRADEETELHVKVERWTNQRKEGWISGENHIHANYGYGQWYNSPPTMRLQCSGEDLNVANFMVANSDGDGVFDREFFLGRPDPHSTDHTVLYWNQEFRATIWGHMTLLNLKYLISPFFTGFKHTTHPHDFPTNADVADHTHEQEGLVNYTHPAHSLQDPYATAYSAKEMPIDVALGKIDTIDVMGSNHQATYPVWYRLLNCGLRVPASAGTDCFLNRVVSRLPGSDRVYVHCPDKFTYQTWIDNLRAGRTFVTNGPMLRFVVNDLEAGSVIRLEAPGTVRVRAEVNSQYPLEKLELVVNGEAVKSIGATPETSLRMVVNESLEIARSGWIAVRVRGPRGVEQSASELFAHTSPVYVEVAGRPVRSPEDARYFIQWIERLWQDVRKRNRIPAGQQAHVEKQIVTALEFYKRLAEQH